jgi:hypothetical protein
MNYRWWMEGGRVVGGFDTWVWTRGLHVRLFLPDRV